MGTCVNRNNWYLLSAKYIKEGKWHIVLIISQQWDWSPWDSDKKKWTNQCRLVTIFEENKKISQITKFDLLLTIPTLSTYYLFKKIILPKTHTRVIQFLKVKDWDRTFINTFCVCQPASRGWGLGIFPLTYHYGASLKFRNLGRDDIKQKP